MLTEVITSPDVSVCKPLTGSDVELPVVSAELRAGTAASWLDAVDVGLEETVLVVSMLAITLEEEIVEMLALEWIGRALLEWIICACALSVVCSEEDETLFVVELYSVEGGKVVLGLVPLKEE